MISTVHAECGLSVRHACTCLPTESLNPFPSRHAMRYAFKRIMHGSARVMKDTFGLGCKLIQTMWSAEIPNRAESKFNLSYVTSQFILISQQSESTSTPNFRTHRYKVTTQILTNPSSRCPFCNVPSVTTAACTNTKPWISIFRCGCRSRECTKSNPLHPSFYAALTQAHQQSTCRNRYFRIDSVESVSEVTESKTPPRN